MKKTMVIQGREITDDDIESVQRLIKANPSWKRTQLSKELCLLWNWRATLTMVFKLAYEAQKT